jgi:conserved oligomeric Golgi complex subunit 3
LLRNHFTNSLKEISADVQKRIADKQLNDTTMSALLYAKFRVDAPELKRMGLEIQRRAVVPAGADPGTEPEYQGLMNELYQSYAAARRRLLLPIVIKKMADIANTPSTSKDLVAFARTAITFIRGICFDEYDLWYEWFYSDGALYEFLEGVCEPFYDYLRPRTIHETQILKLCELCTLIQTRYMGDEEGEADSPTGPKLEFAALIHPALEDAQTRLLFLAVTILRNDIEYFKPQPADLDYPAKNHRVKSKQPVLSGRKTSNGPLTPMPKTPTVVEEDGGEPHFVFDPSSSDWYPTLKKAVWLLSRIYRLVHVSLPSQVP